MGIIFSYGFEDALGDGELRLVSIDIPESRFPLGTIVASRGITHASDKTIVSDNTRLPVRLAPEFEEMIRAHARGEWGNLCNEDIEANETALHDGYRLLSAYLSAEGERVYVITEADRSVTTILFASEY